MRTWVLDRFGRYGQVCLMAAVFLSAVIFAPLPVDPFNPIKLTLLWTLMILALGFWLASCMAGRAMPPRARLFYPAVAFIFSLFVATLASTSPTFSVLGHYSRYGGLIPYLSYALIAFAIYALFWDRPESLRWLARSAWLASVFVAGYVFIQEAGLDWKKWQGPGGAVPVSPGSTLGNSNFAGGYLAATLPLAMYSIVSIKSVRTRMTLSGMLGLHILALWYTQARSGMAGALVGILVLSWCYRERLPLWLKFAMFTSLVLVSTVAVVAIWHPGASRQPEAVRAVRQLDSFSLQTRFWYWTASARIFRDHPLVGTGPDTYLFFYPRYRVAEDGRNMGLNLTDKPHNVLLEHFSNEGAMGGISYLGTAGLGLWYGYRRSRKLGGEERLLVTCFTGALAAYMTQGFFSIDVPALAVMGWIPLGAIAALADPAAVATRQRRLDASSGGMEQAGAGDKRNGGLGKKFRLALIYTGLLATMLGLIALGTRPLRADIKSAAGRTEEAIKLNPWEGEYYIRAGDRFRSIAASTRDPSLADAFYARAERQYERALRIQPANLLYMIRVAALYSLRSQRIDPAQVIEAHRRWGKILHLNPTDRDVKSAYRSAGRAKGRVIEQAERSVEIRPADSRVWIDLGRIYLELGKKDDAERAFRKAVGLAPTDKEAQRLLKESSQS